MMTTGRSRFASISQAPVVERRVDVLAVANVAETAEALRKLESLVGLAEVKGQVRSLVNRARMRQRRNQIGLVDSDDDFSYHLVFEGNPGTGSTTSSEATTTSSVTSRWPTS